MKTQKKFAVVLFVMGAICTMNAQYFQKMYNFNATSNELAGKGVNEVLTGGNNLYVQAGTSIYTPIGTTVSTTAPMVASTDAAGLQNFCSVYPFPTLSGNTVRARGRAVARDPNTGNLVIVGDFTSVPTNFTGIFFFQVTSTGAVVAGSLKYFFHPANRAIDAAAIKIVPGATTQIVACGRAESATSTGNYNPWVARWDVNFVSGWFRIYDENAAGSTWNARANDLVETSFGGVSEIGVVGEQILTGNYRGFLMRLNPATGSLLNYTTYDLGANFDDRLTSITKCNDGSPAVGYLMAGYTNSTTSTTPPTPPNPRVWALRTNNTGLTINWSNRYTYPVSTASCFANGIVERINTLGAFEYYISGSTTSGVIGNADVLLYKLAPTGVLPTGNVITIGVTGATDEYAINIDKADVGSTVPGLTIYGLRNVSGNNDFYKVKCYFNGKMTTSPSCKDSSSMASRIAQITSTVAFAAPSITVSPNSQPNPSSISGNQTFICNVASIIGGNNSRLINTTSSYESAMINGELAINAYPNPLQNNQDLHLSVNSPLTQSAEITIINLLGKVVYSSTRDLDTGVNNLELILPQLNEGVYTVCLLAGKSRKNVLISITH
jgi:hypothetical protein